MLQIIYLILVLYIFFGCDPSNPFKTIPCQTWTDIILLLPSNYDIRIIQGPDDSHITTSVLDSLNSMAFTTFLFLNLVPSALL